jgi:PAS domain S-box-containing protein
MKWNNVITTFPWPSIIIILFLLCLSIYSWRHRSVPGALQFVIGSLFACVWLFAILMETTMVDPPAKIFWIKFQAVCQLPVLTANTCFSLEYVWPGRWLKRKNVILLTIPPLLFLVLTLTNDLHHLVWQGFVVNGSIIKGLVGPIIWPCLIYGFVLSVLMVIILLWLLQHSPHNRRPITLMLMGIIISRTFYFLDRLEIVQTTLNLNTFLIGYLYLMFAFVLFAYRIFDPISLARRMVIAQMRDGMLVLNSQGQVASMNPVAESILGVKNKQARRRSIQEFFPEGMDLSDRLAEKKDCQMEIHLGTNSNAHDYLLSISALKDWHGLMVGNLLLLRDVTEHKQAQAKIIEQQRALAVARERELLARELHDSTSQVLGYANLKIGATRKLIADGKLAAADSQLERLENVVSGAHADIREYILNLRIAPTGETSFFSAMQQYLNKFCHNYGIQVDLHINEGVSDETLTPEAQMQVFRILQEALSNAHKHANTNHIQVSFIKDGDRVRMRIQDNGCGFDLKQAAGKVDHYGLLFMRERAEQLGGCLQVISAPGAGTCIELEAPCSCPESGVIHDRI